MASTEQAVDRIAARWNLTEEMAKRRLVRELASHERNTEAVTTAGTNRIGFYHAKFRRMHAARPPMQNTGPITFTPDEIRKYYAVRVPRLKQRGAEWRGPCPIHKGKGDNFTRSREAGWWYCHSTCGRGGDILDLEAALTGADFRTCKAEVFRIVGRTEPEYRHNGNHTNGHLPGREPSEPTKPTGAAAENWRDIARYPYTDQSGTLLFEVVRQERGEGAAREKKFVQRRPDGQGGWIWKLDGVERVPYRLPKVLNADTVYLVEGEKDVHTLEEWGLVASCNPGGSGSSHLYAKWAEYFQDRHVIILPDNDPPGRKHAAAVAEALLSVAASIRIVELPSLPEKGDVTDWRDAGGTLEHFSQLSRAEPPIDEAALSELRARWQLEEQESPRKTRAETGSLVTRRLCDIPAKPVNWLWPGRIARGKVSIIAGNPGLGKSQVTASIAAIVTTGGRWPVDGSQCTPGDVVFLSAEDDPADTLRPRLEAAGADLRRVHIIDAVLLGCQQQPGMFNMQRDLVALSAKLSELGSVAAVVIDPITAYLGNVDSHRNAEVRALLSPLAELAASHGAAIIVISHLNKSAGTQALMRVTGSLGFVAAARAAYLVEQDPGDPARRLFVPMKNNIGPDSTGLAFSIQAATVESETEPLQTSRVVWESAPVSMTADEVMATQAPEGRSALREAEEWLRDTVGEPVLSSELFRMAAEVGISQKTLRRAAASVGIVKQKTGMKEGWMWSLPPKMAKVSEDAQHNCLGTFGDVGHLRDSKGAMVEVQL